MKKKELRFFKTKELRMDEVDGAPVIRGHAALFNQLSVDFGGWNEIIRPGAFTNSLATGPDVRALIDHETGLMTIGRTRNGTLSLAEDGEGLRVEIHPPDTQAGRDVVKLIERGDLNQMSFGFWTIRDNWLQTGETVLRELIEVDIDDGDVSVVTYAAYPQTNVALRNQMNIPEMPEEFRQASDSDNDDGTDARARMAQRRRILKLAEMES